MTLVADGATFAEVRRNLAGNPRALSGGSGYYSTSGGTGGSVDLSYQTGAVSSPDGLLSYVMVQRTAAPSGSDWMRVAPSGQYAGVPGEVFTCSAWVMSTSNQVEVLIVRFYDSSGARILEIPNREDIPRNVWIRLYLTFTVPAGAVSFDVAAGLDATIVGDRLRMSGLQIEKSASLGSFFDGATPNTLVKRYSWTGTANASASIESEPVAADRIDPLMVLGPWERVVPLRTEAHQLLDSNEARYSTRPAAAAGGELRMLFATYAAAVDAAGKLASGRVWQMSEPIGVDPTPVTERMMFTGGDITIEQAAQAVGKFVLSAPWSAAA